MHEMNRNQPVFRMSFSIHYQNGRVLEIETSSTTPERHAVHPPDAQKDRHNLQVKRHNHENPLYEFAPHGQPQPVFPGPVSRTGPRQGTLRRPFAPANRIHPHWHDPVSGAAILLSPTQSLYTPQFKKDPT